MGTLFFFFTELILATITKCLRLGNNHQEFIAHNFGLSKIKALLASLWYGCLGLSGVLLLHSYGRRDKVAFLTPSRVLDKFNSNLTIFKTFQCC